MHPQIGWTILGALTVGLIATAVWETNTAARLRADVEQARANARRATAAQAKRVQTDAESAATSTALVQAQAEVAGLTNQLQAARAQAAARAEAARFAVDVPMAASEWRNAGRASPKAALETVLWAGAGGDVATLADTLTFIDDRTRREARALWEAAPASSREQYPTPDKFIAFLATKDMPLGSAEVRRLGDLMAGWPAPAEIIEVLLTASDRTRKSVNLLFMDRGDGWKLVVTQPVVAKYAAALQSPGPN